MRSLMGPGSQNSPDPFADLVARLEQMRRELNDLTSSVLKSGGIRVSPDGMTIESSLAVEGSLDVSGTMLVTGDATFEGDLAVPNGSITNDALTNPLTLASDWGETTSTFGLAASTWTELADASITVPPGFTQMQFTAISTTDVINDQAFDNNLYARISRQINGTGTIYGSIGSSVTLLAGFAGTVMNAYVWSTAVTPGDTHRLWTEAWSAAGIGADSYNYARVTVSAIFTR